MKEMLLLASFDGLKVWLNSIGSGALNFAVKVILAAVVLIVGIKIINKLIKLLKKVLEKGKADAGVTSFLCSILKYALYFVLAMIILSQFGVTASSVVAVLGSVGVTIGLALQGSLSNLAGGVLILLLKPFVVGDYIIEKATDQQGTVEAITICYTRLLTTDNQRIMIPNGTLSNTSIINVSTMDKRRVDIKVGVAYDSDIAKVKEVLASLIENDEARLPEEATAVYVDALADSSIIMGARLWVATGDYWTTKWRITENIKLEFDKNGISIPFPQLDVQIKK